MEGYGIYNNISLSALQMLHTIFGQDCPSTSWEKPEWHRGPNKNHK